MLRKIGIVVVLLALLVGAGVWWAKKHLVATAPELSCPPLLKLP